MDDEKARLGVQLANTDLMGIPHRIVIGDRGLEAGNIEYKGRRDAEKQEVPAAEIVESDDRSMVTNETGDSTRTTHDYRALNWNKRAEKLLENYKEFFIW
jgi:hypothetical protein